MGKIIDFPVKLLGKAGVKSEKNAKLIVYGTSIVIGGIIVYIIGKKLKNLIFPDHYTAITMQDDLTKLDINGGNLTISQNDATLIANNLHVAMNWFGTDDQAVIDNITRCQTRDDLLLVIKTFGVKLYDGFGLGEDWFSRKISTPKDLAGWIRAEMSGANLATVKNLFDYFNVPF
jgi:hypothetical protein